MISEYTVDLAKFLMVSMLIALVVPMAQCNPLTDSLGESEWCKNRLSTDFIRPPGSTDCREAIRCTLTGLVTIRCFSGMGFDLDRQVCDWKHKVLDCEPTESSLKRRQSNGYSYETNGRDSPWEYFVKRSTLDPIFGITIGKRFPTPFRI